MSGGRWSFVSGKPGLLKCGEGEQQEILLDWQDHYDCEDSLLDLETMNIVNTQMYIDGYQVKLVSDTSYGSLWEVSFTLKEF